MAEATQGPDLETIATEALGFLSIAGEAKVRITSPWTDAPPTKHASLLSIASRRGLVAAAGPDAVILANTDTVRKAFDSPRDGGSDIRSLQPELRLAMDMRVSLLSFTADENLLLLSAESGGGLAVYDVAALLQGSTQSAFELGTNGESLRALAPNPTNEKAELCAVLTEGGNLHMANLRDRSLGPLLRAQVSSIAWSTRGKQLVAGLADGMIAQITPEGEVKAMIPKPPSVEGDFHVSSIAWLENNVFLVIHTSTNQEPATSIYNIITRTPPSSFSYQKLNDPVDPYGSEKPVHHSIARLKDYAPNITDLLLVTSTASMDVGMLSRAKQPLDPEKPAESITNVFTLTELVDDSKRATIPMTETMDDSIAIGSALDLSSKDTVYKPITAHELEESPGPLPGFWLLTHEGILCVWWVIYADAIKQGVTYQGMAVVEEASGLAPGTPAPGASRQTPAGTPAVALTFGAPTSAPAFGAPTAPAPAFGGATALGTRPSPWGSSNAVTSASAGGAVFGSSTFGSAPAATAAPVFGQPSQPSFGQSAGLGMKQSPWATGGSASTGTSFGQSGFAALANSDDKSQSTFGSGAGTGAGGFAGFASKGGFAALSGDKPSGGAFGSGASLSMDTETSFPPPKPDTQPGNGFSGFKLESSFKRDPTADQDEPANAGGGGSFFGSAFGSALGGSAAKPTAHVPVAKEEEMGGAGGEVEPEPKPKTSVFGGSGTPAPATEEPKFGASTSSPGGGMFGSTSSTPAPAAAMGGSMFASKPAASTPTSFGSKPSTAMFGQAMPASSGLLAGSSIFGQKSAAQQPTPAKEDETPAPASTGKAKDSTGDELPPDFLPKAAHKPAEAPLPPDFARSKPAKSDDAPMPPDFLKPAVKEKAAPAPRSSPNPLQVPVPQTDSASDEDDDDGFSEGSGVDVANELSPSTAALSQNVGTTSQSSFGGGGLGGSFDMPRPETSASSMFGEVGSGKAPALPPSQTEGPLAPSHGRSLQPGVRQDNLRSVSAPGIAAQLLERRSPMQQQQQQFKQSRLGESIIGSQRQPSVDPFAQSHRQSHAIREAEEQQPLIDEDDGPQELLASKLEPTLELDEFVAHTDVVTAANESISSQVEAVYRDINAMIDTLGINARSLACFIRGHKKLGQMGGRYLEDLETPDNWTLGELKELTVLLLHHLGRDLTDGRVKDLDGKLMACKDLSRDLGRLRARRAELERVVAARIDPEQAGTARSFPLTPEQNAQQNDLRREYVRFNKLLADTEEGLMLLKARIASANGSAAGGRHGPGTPGGTAVPTVDAVIRTISKMTSIAEKRSGDVDVLENQMRKMRLNSVARSREGTPSATATPQKRGSIIMAPSSSLLSPDSSSIYTVTPRRNLRASFAASVATTSVSGGGVPSSPVTRRRPVTSGFTAEEKAALMQRQARRRDVLAKLEAHVIKEGVKTWTTEESAVSR